MVAGELIKTNLFCESRPSPLRGSNVYLSAGPSQLMATGLHCVDMMGRTDMHPSRSEGSSMARTRTTDSARDGFFAAVYDMVKQVPRGTVATYGQIAALIGAPRRARYVGYALHVNPDPGPIPCHRIVFADGRLADGFAFGGPEAQRAMLEAEGVAFLPDGRVDLAVSRWTAGIA